MILEEIKEALDYFRENLYEMSAFNNKTTGLSNGNMLWVRTEPKVLQHVKYRIKVKHPQYGIAIYAIWGEEAMLIDKQSSWHPSGRDDKKIKTLISMCHKELIQHIDGILSSAALSRKFFEVRSIIEKI